MTPRSRDMKNDGAQRLLMDDDGVDDDSDDTEQVVTTTDCLLREKCACVTDLIIPRVNERRS